jgi:tetratricopeptide (TPR) repeat protein
VARTWWALLLLAGALTAQPPPAEPPEEDETLKTKEYDFNPLQAQNELKVGEFYAKKGAWKAAAMRFEEATRWNAQLPEAWRRLGDAREKLKDLKARDAAWRKFLELAPEAKEAPAIRKKLEKKS